MPELPTGTVTLLFSDIEGSTLLLARLGDAYAEALDRQRSVLRRAWSTHGGREIGTEGDSFFVVFDVARNAVRAALDAQRELASVGWPQGEVVRVRMGLHTGEPTLHEGGYVGMDVHRAARVAAAAHGGQVVVTDATSLVVRDGLPDGTRLVDLGRHRLKDLAVPEHLFQLSADGLSDMFPPLRTLGTSSSLPPQATPLVGRDGELTELRDLILDGGVRLLTLTGPGGSGKTSLAVALAGRLVEAFPDGVYFVPLAGATGSDAAWSAITEALSTSGEARNKDRLLQELTHRRLLLVLDNLEQLAAADVVVAELLAAAPHLAVVATSRRPLHLRGEREHAVPPLKLPDRAEVADAAGSGAVQLFCQHAQMVRSDFRLTDDNVESVTAICRRLDGLPLAIELAAARSKLLSPGALLGRLGSTLDVRSAARDRPARQRSLHDTIAWSYNLLNPELQLVFRRLGVFAGSADLDAVQAVAGGSDPLDDVAALVDLSLCGIVDGPSGEPRVRLLETVQEFALDRLDAKRELDDIRHRHAQHYLHVAHTLVAELRTAQHLVAADRLEAEHDNFRSALRWGLQPDSDEAPNPDRAGLGLKLAAALWWFWASQGHVAEGDEWLTRAIEVAPEGDSAERAAALHGVSVQAIYRPDPEEPFPAKLQQAFDMYGRLGDLSGLSDVANTLAQWHFDHGDPAEANTLFEQSIAWAREAGDEARLASAMQYFAWLVWEQGDRDRAVELIEGSAVISGRIGNERDALHRRVDLIDIQFESGDVLGARVRFDELVPDVLRVRQPALSVVTITSYLKIFFALGETERAVRLLSAREVLGLDMGWPSWIEMEHLAERMAHARETLGEAVYERAVETGTAYTAEEALQDAIRPS